MIVVIDVDETVTAAPVFFSWLSRALRRDGHRVIILTVRRDREDTARLLVRLGVAWDELVTPPPEADRALEWKISRARELAPDVLIDDCVDLVNALDVTTFALVPRDAEQGRLDYVD